MNKPGKFDRIKAFAASRWGIVIKVVLTAIIIWYFVTSIDWPVVLQSFQQMDWRWFPLMIVLLGFRYWFLVERFYSLISGIFPLTRWIIFLQYCVMHWTSVFLPSVVGGEGVRWVLLAREGVDKTHAAVYVLLERLLGLLSLAMISGTFLLFHPDGGLIPLWIRLAVWSGAMIGVLGMMYALFSRIKLLVPSFLKPAITALRERPKNALIAFSWTLLVQIVSVSVTWAIAMSFGFSITIWQCFMLVPIIWIMIALPISFGGIGVREATFVLLFGFIGTSSEQALALSLGTYAVFIVNGLPGLVAPLYLKQ